MPKSDRVSDRAGRFYVCRRGEDYVDMVARVLIPDDRIRNHPLIKKMLLFVLYNRVPLIFDEKFLASEKSEGELHAYLAYYGIVAMPGFRGRYRRVVIRSLFGFHEVCHMCMIYPLSTLTIKPDYFNSMLQINEWTASNLSEILIYFLMKEQEVDLREETRRPFTQILYDVIVSQNPGWTPTLQELFNLRKLIFESLDTYKQMHPKFPKVWQFFEKFVDGNLDWNEERLRDTIGLKLPMILEPGKNAITLLDDLAEYEPVLPGNFQAHYEKMILDRTITLVRILNHNSKNKKQLDEPKDFMQALDILKQASKRRIVISHKRS